jgi:hypothetical protein
MEYSLHFDVADCCCDPRATSISVNEAVSTQYVHDRSRGSDWSVRVGGKTYLINYTFSTYFCLPHNVVHADEGRSISKTTKRKSYSHDCAG